MGFKTAGQKPGMVVYKNGVWVFGRGKYLDQPLSCVAAEDLGYLQWVYRDAAESLDNDAYYALQDILEQCRPPQRRKN